MPVLLLFLSLAGTAGDDGSVTAQMVHLMLEEIGIGALVGIPFAVIGSSALKTSIRNGWIQRSWIQVPVISLALLCFATAQWLGGSGFIASFAGGMTFGVMVKQANIPGTETLIQAVTWTVLLSVIAHGITANPFAKAYAGRVNSRGGEVEVG